MTAFLLVSAALTLVVLGVVLLPLLRGGGEAPARGAFDRAVYRDQMAELERDAARGMIGAREAEAARLEIQRRLLGRDGAGAASWRTGRSPALALALAVLVVCGAGGFYLVTGAPGIPSIAARPPVDGVDTAAMREAVAELERRLVAEPNNGEGWLLLARSAASMGQWPRAIDAYRRALALVPATPEILVAASEAMVLGADGVVIPAAQAGFAKALAEEPGQPVARFYLAVAEAQAGRHREAIAAWENLAADLPAGVPIRDEIARRIAASARAAGVAAPALPPPSEAPDPAARDAMIRGMVARLAERLAAEPNDADGWLRLGRSYAVLGEAAKSAEAYARAATLRPDDLSIPLAEAQALLEGLAPTAPFPPRALELLRRVAAVDPKQPSALWHLGVEAAKRGAMGEAAAFWERLLALLPPEGDDAKMVRSALEAVRRR